MNNIRKAINEKLNVEKINEVTKTSNKILKLIYVVLIIVLVYAITLILKEWNLFSILFAIIKVISPFFIGFLIAWLLNPAVTKLNEKGISRPISVILVFVLMLIFIYLFILALIPTLANQINDMVSSIPGLLNELKIFVDNIFNILSDNCLINLSDIKIEFFTSIETWGKTITTALPSTLLNFVQSLVSGLGVIAISFVIGFYMLFNFNNVSAHLINILPRKIKQEAEYLLGEISVVMHKFVNGTLLISLILFVVSIIGFSIIGLNAPVLFAFFCAITNLIPYIGPYLGGAPAVLIGFSQSPLVGIFTLIFVIVVQLLESNFLHPIVIGKKMDLHPVTIMISLLIFGYFFGIIGMIVATPIMAIFKILYIFLDNKYDFFGYTKSKSIKKELSKLKKTV